MVVYSEAEMFSKKTLGKVWGKRRKIELSMPWGPVSGVAIFQSIALKKALSLVVKIATLANRHPSKSPRQVQR